MKGLTMIGRSVCFAAMLMLSATLACAQTPAPVAAGPATIEDLGPLPATVVGRAMSSDGRRIALACQEDQKFWVSVDGQDGPEYDGINKDSLAFSPDGKRVAYVAKKREQWVMVADGQAGEGFASLSGPIFSPDGKRLAYLASRAGGQAAVVDGQASETYEHIEWVFFSADGKHVGYAVNKDQQRLMMVDGQAGPAYDDLVGWASMFAPQGPRMAYAANNGRRWISNVDGEESPEYQDMRGPLFSRDGRHVLWSGEREGKVYVAVDGKEGTPHRPPIAGNPFFSDDARHVALVVSKGEGRVAAVVDEREEAEYPQIDGLSFVPGTASVVYRVRKDEKWLAVIAGQPGPVYDQVGAVTCSPQGGRAAYAARTGGKWRVVADGKPGPEYDDVSTPLFSPDGKRLAYAARGKANKWCVVVDGQAGPDCDAVGKGTPVFSPDGKHLVYVAEKGQKQAVMVDGQAGPDYDLTLPAAVGFKARARRAPAAKGKSPVAAADKGVAQDYDLGGQITPLFSSDGRHMAYSAHGDGAWQVVIDGHAGPQCQAIVNPEPARYSFDADGTLVYLAIKDDSLCRVRQKP